MGALLSLFTNTLLPMGPASQAGEHPIQVGKLSPGCCMAPVTGRAGLPTASTSMLEALPSTSVSRLVQPPCAGWEIWGCHDFRAVYAAMLPVSLAGGMLGCAEAHMESIGQELLLQSHFPEQTERPPAVPFARSR